MHIFTPRGAWVSASDVDHTSETNLQHRVWPLSPRELQSQSCSSYMPHISCTTNLQFVVTLQGVGSIMGGIIVMQAGNGNVEYVFTEKNFGHFASNAEVEKQVVCVSAVIKSVNDYLCVLCTASADSCILYQHCRFEIQGNHPSCQDSRREPKSGARQELQALRITTVDACKQHFEACHTLTAGKQQ